MFLLSDRIINGIVRRGDVAQMVERSLSMREVRGSIPRISISFSLFPEFVRKYFPFPNPFLENLRENARKENTKEKLEERKSKKKKKWIKN